MLSTLKKVIPLSWRDRLRPQWEMLQEECKELAFPLQHNAARTKKSGLQAAANLEEAFRVRANRVLHLPTQRGDLTCLAVYPRHQTDRGRRGGHPQ